MTHVSDFSDEQVDGFVTILESFLLAREDTFATMDQVFDSAAESEAAKKGWTSAVSGLSLVIATAQLMKTAEKEKTRGNIN